MWGIPGSPLVLPVPDVVKSRGDLRCQCRGSAIIAGAADPRLIPSPKEWKKDLGIEGLVGKKVGQ